MTDFNGFSRTWRIYCKLEERYLNAEIYVFLNIQFVSNYTQKIGTPIIVALFFIMFLYNQTDRQLFERIQIEIS